MKLGFIYTILRKEEVLIINELEKQGVVVVKVCDRDVTLNGGIFNFNTALIRSISLSRALHISRIFESAGIKCINSHKVINTCGNKFYTSVALSLLPTPKFKLCFEKEAALKAIEEIGFPCVLKPVVGSWGRLISKVNDLETAESFLEHKEAPYYIQEYIDAANSDIRTIVIGNKVIGAIKRTGSNFRANTALGAEVQKQHLTKEIEGLSLKAAQAIGNGILSVDLFESEKGLLVNEVNATTEFRKSLEQYDVNIAEEIAKYVKEEYK